MPAELRKIACYDLIVIDEVLGPGASVEDVLLDRCEKDSMVALSPQAPTRPMDPTMWVLDRIARGGR